MRARLVALLLSWGGGLGAAEMAVGPDGRWVLPSVAVAVELRLADAVPVAAAAGKRVLTQPGLLAPAAEWRTAAGVAVQLDLCRVQRPVGLSEIRFVAARLRLTNPTAHPQSTGLAVALLPAGELRSLAFDRHAFFLEDRPLLVADTPSSGAILAESPLAPRPLTPQATAHVASATGECRGEMLYDFALAPGQTRMLGWLCPLDGALSLEACRALLIDEIFAQAEKETTAAR